MAKTPDPSAQITLLGKSNLRYEIFDARITSGYVEGKLPEYNPEESPDNDPTKVGLELYRQMKINPTVLLNHTTEDERTYYNSILTLEPGFGTNAAISMARNKRDDILTAARYKAVESQVMSIQDSQATYKWYSYIPMMFNDPEFVPLNVTEMQTDLARLTKEYISFGVDPQKALEVAAKDYGLSHKRIRNISIPITVGLPDDIEELADIAVEQTLMLSPGMKDEYGNGKELSIKPVVPGQNERWYVVHGGGFPVINEGKFVEFFIGKPYPEDTPVFMGTAPAGSFPADSLRGMLSSQESVDKVLKTNIMIKKQNIEIESRTESGRFEGLNRRDARRLKEQLIAEAENKTTVDQKVKTSVQSSLEYLKGAFSLDNDIIRWINENEPGELIVRAAQEGGKFALDFAKQAEENANKVRQNNLRNKK